MRGSVTQNVSARVRAGERDGVGFLVRLGLLIALLVAVLIVGVVGWHSGWPARKARQLTEAALDVSRIAHFEVKDIIVQGRRQSNKEEILDALGTGQGLPIFGVDLAEAAQRIGRLPWVSRVVVERRLPDTLVIVLTEREALARWQQNERFFVIDTEGQILPSAKAENFADLPLVVGAGAERAARALFALLADYPSIREKTTAAVRVGQRRWDLHLSKIVVRLPEDNPEKALRRLLDYIHKDKILNRDIVAVDLRIPDRYALEPAPGAKIGDFKK